jgi:hypothetical protein
LVVGVVVVVAVVEVNGTKVGHVAEVQPLAAHVNNLVRVIFI